jgi:hypothetical protein
MRKNKDKREPPYILGYKCVYDCPQKSHEMGIN